VRQRVWQKKSQLFSSQQEDQQRSTPAMPSQLFRELAQSQIELLASSLVSTDRPGTSKAKSMSLYLPQENQQTGQLEFIPAVLYPHPDSDRVFIAPEADSRGLTLPNTLTRLPGFAHASTLIPGYPMLSGAADAGIGPLEEVFCGLNSMNGAAALSVTLFAGPQTVGVLLVSPDESLYGDRKEFWTEADRQKVTKAARSLSLALSMETERTQLVQRNRVISEALSDSLHQLKNPVQALRTYGKLLQQRIADSEEGRYEGKTLQLLELANHLMVQSDRVVTQLGPIDSIVEAMGSDSRPMFTLAPARPQNRENVSLVPWSPRTPAWEREAFEFAQRVVPEMDTNQKTVKNGGSDTTASESNDDSWDEMRLPLRDRLELEIGFVDDVLSETLAAFQAMAGEQKIEFSVVSPDELPGVTINANALQEVVVNLLDNAFKYVMLPKRWSASNKNQKPVVRIRLLANKTPLPAGVTLLIEDNGPGVSTSEYGSIFERGFRSSATKHQVRGTGLGLDIVRSLVVKMGGTIRVVPSDDSLYSPALDGTQIELRLFRNPPL
jgi:signal transduction histidine kinase